MVRSKFKFHPELNQKLDRIETILDKLQSSRLSSLIHEFAENDQIGSLMTVLAHLVGVNVLKYENARREEVSFRTPYICFVCSHTETLNHIAYLLESGYARLQYHWYLSVRMLDTELILQNITTQNYNSEFFYILEPSPYLRFSYDRSPFPSQRARFIHSIYEDMESLSVGIVGFYEMYYGHHFWDQLLFDI